MRFLLFALAMILVAGAGFGVSTPKPEGAVVLTVGGAIGQSNRDAFDEKSDTLFAYHSIGFDRAFAFDREMLGDLNRAHALVQPPQRDKPHKYSGPKLSALIEAVGAQGKTLRFVALDGYASEMSPEQIAAKNWIVVTHEDDEPLELGRQGPIWLMHKPAEGVEPTAAEEAAWPWAVFYIEVVEAN